MTIVLGSIAMISQQYLVPIIIHHEVSAVPDNTVSEF